MKLISLVFLLLLCSNANASGLCGKVSRIGTLDNETNYFHLKPNGRPNTTSVFKILPEDLSQFRPLILKALGNQKIDTCVYYEKVGDESQVVNEVKLITY